jgi:hypothetical protein
MRGDILSNRTENVAGSWLSKLQYPGYRDLWDMKLEKDENRELEDYLLKKNYGKLVGV